MQFGQRLVGGGRQGDWGGGPTLRCLRALVECGSNVIFDLCIPSSKFADTFQADLRDLSPITVAVRCEWTEIERRTLQRGDRSLEEAERTFKNQHHLESYDLVIDTTAISPEAAAEEYITSRCKTG